MTHFNRHANDGVKDQYLLKTTMTPIISHEDFKAAQAVNDHRGKEKGIKKEEKKYLKRYPCSGKIICGQ